MSYCRFIEGDVYLYADVRGGITCAACWLAPKVTTIFTTGKSPLFRSQTPCSQCQGVGCEACMMHGSQNFASVQDAYDHLLAHRQAGHDVPQRALDELIQEGACSSM